MYDKLFNIFEAKYLPPFFSKVIADNFLDDNLYYYDCFEKFVICKSLEKKML